MIQSIASFFLKTNDLPSNLRWAEWVYVNIFILKKEHTITCWGTSLTYTCVEVYVCVWGLAHAYAKPPFPLQGEAFWHNQIARAALFYPWEYINFSLGAAFLLVLFSMINMKTFLKGLQNQSKMRHEVRINWMKAWTIEVCKTYCTFRVDGGPFSDIHKATMESRSLMVSWRVDLRSETYYSLIPDSSWLLQTCHELPSHPCFLCLSHQIL